MRMWVPPRYNWFAQERTTSDVSRARPRYLKSLPQSILQRKESIGWERFIWLHVTKSVDFGDSVEFFRLSRQHTPFRDNLSTIYPYDATVHSELALAKYMRLNWFGKGVQALKRVLVKRLDINENYNYISSDAHFQCHDEKPTDTLTPTLILTPTACSRWRGRVILNDFSIYIITMTYR